MYAQAPSHAQSNRFMFSRSQEEAKSHERVVTPSIGLMVSRIVESDAFGKSEALMPPRSIYTSFDENLSAHQELNFGILDTKTQVRLQAWVNTKRHHYVARLPSNSSHIHHNLASVTPRRPHCIYLFDNSEAETRSIGCFDFVSYTNQFIRCFYWSGVQKFTSAQSRWNGVPRQPSLPKECR